MRGRGRWLVLALAVAAVAAIAWYVRVRSTPRAGPVAGAAGSAGPRERAGAGGPGAAGGAQQARPVPVTAAQVGRQDVPVYLQGLGNVVAYRTVTVRSQVDGRLDKVLFREGQSVRAGEVLAQIDPRPFQIQLHQAEGALARDQAQLAGARRNLERYRELATQKLVSQQQADDQAALVGQLEGAVQIDRAAIETARLNLDYARIRSPIDGVTGIRIVDPGNLVRAADATGIVVVTQLDPIAVVFTLPQDQLTSVLDELSRRSLQVDVFSRDGSVKLGAGQLALVDNQINQATSTIRLKAVVPNPKRHLWPNQFVNARLLLTVRQGALVMPVTAVQRGPSGAFVYVVGRDMTATPRPIELEATQGDLAVVARGVQEGEQVVVEGQNQLRPGSRIAPREAGRPGSGPPMAGDGRDAQRAADGGGRPPVARPGPQEASPQATGAGGRP